jgi:hypothetical protein
MSQVTLKLADAQYLLRALETGNPPALQDAANKLRASIKQHKRISVRRRAWWIITRLIPIVTVWTLLGRMLLLVGVLSMPQCIAAALIGSAACLLLPSVVTLLFWVPLAVLQYGALGHLVATCAFPQACSGCNWAMRGAVGAVNMRQLQDLIVALIPFKLRVETTWWGGSDPFVMQEVPLGVLPQVPGS